MYFPIEQFSLTVQASHAVIVSVFCSVMILETKWEKNPDGRGRTQLF